MKARVLVSLVAFLCGAVSEMRAQFIWTGAGADSDVLTPANWQGGVAPIGSGTEDFTFSYSGVYAPTFSVPVSLRNVTISAPFAYYHFVGTGPVTLTGDLTTDPATFSAILLSAPLTLAAGTHYLTIGGSESPGSDVTVLGPVTGPGNIVKYGVSTLTFDHAGNTFSGYVQLVEGTIKVHGDGALGAGTVYMAGGALVALDTYNDSHTTVLANNFYLADNSYFGEYGGKGSLTITGTTTIQVGTSAAVVHLLGDGLLTLGNVSEPGPGTSLVFDGGGSVRLTGTNGYSGGTQALNLTTVIFSGAPPGTGLLVAYDDSYIGTEVATGIQGGFLNHFDSSNTTGVMGFDTANLNSPVNVTENIDLTDFNAAVRIGTATAAVFHGTITPQADTYQFGGRGTLTVASDLGGEITGLDASAGVHLFLTGNNSYGGPTTVQAGAAIVFDRTAALSDWTTLSSEAGGYIGHTEATEFSPGYFLERFSAAATYGVIGFDAAEPLYGRVESRAIDLSGFAGSVFLGSSTSTTLTGTLTPAGANYQFTGFRDGHLTVSSTLSGSAGVVIGLPAALVHNPAPVGVVFAPSVTLDGANTYTGGTTLQSGLLVLGHASALGTGALTISAYAPATALATSVPGLTFSNAIEIGFAANFTIGGANDFTLAGHLIGPTTGSFNKIDTNSVTLTADNSTLGQDLNIRSGILVFGNQYAAGGGVLRLWNYDGAYDGQAVVNTSSVVVSGLAGEDRTRINLAAGNLVVSQNANSEFAGQLFGTGALVKLGYGTLYLTGTNLNSGGTEVNGGTLVVSHGSIAHSSGDITVGFGSGDDGVLNIVDGSTVASVNGNLGQYPGGNGIVIVAGAGSSWNVSNNLSVGLMGSGTLSLSAGGTVSSFAGYIGLDGTGVVSVSGAGSGLTATDIVVVGGNSPSGDGALSIMGGGTVASGRGSIGDTGAGAVTIEGSGSAWLNSGPLYVGANGGTGSFAITNGGTVTSSYAEIGLGLGTGLVMIRDPGSNWTTTSNFEIGNPGMGILELFGLAAVNVAGGTGTIVLAPDPSSTGRLLIGDSEVSPYGGIINAASIAGGGGTSRVEFDTGATRAAPYYLTKDGTAGGAPVLLTGTLEVKNYQGFTVLSGANTYAGGTYLFGGTLVAANNSALGTSVVYFEGGRLSVLTGITLSNPLSLTGGGSLGGNGAFGSAITVDTGISLTPGNSVGLLTFSSGLTWGPGGTYDLEIQSAVGARGIGYDSIDVTGGLTFTATLGAPFTLNLLSLNGGGAPGAVADFNSGNGYAFLIAHSDSLVGFNPANVTINTTGFVNSLGSGAFNVTSIGNDVYLNFSPVPEPSALALLALGLGFVMGYLVWRRCS